MILCCTRFLRSFARRLLPTLLYPPHRTSMTSSYAAMALAKRTSADAGVSSTDNGVGPESPGIADADVCVDWDETQACTLPSQRKGCAVVVWEGRPILFGGDGGRGVRFNDVHMFNLGTCLRALGTR